MTFSPLDLSPDLWLDSSDTATITSSGGLVSQWRDKSGHARHFSQSSDALKFTVGATTRNGHDIVGAAGTTNAVSAGRYMECPSWAPPTSAGTIVGVVRRRGTDQSRAWICLGTSSHLAAALRTGGSGSFGAALGGVANIETSQASETVGTWVVQAVHRGSGTNKVRRNGVELTVTSGASTSPLAASGMARLPGDTTAPQNNPAHDYAEILYFPVELTEDQLVQVETYLNEKWGFTVPFSFTTGTPLSTTSTSAAAFPLSPVPSGHPYLNTNKRCNIHHPGESVTILSTGSITGTYEVVDLEGTVWATGTLAGVTSFAIPTPAGGWPLGWYRVRCYRSTFDSLFGYARGSMNFVVVNNDSRFGTRPVIGTAGVDYGYGGESPDFPTKGYLGIGTSRLQITDSDINGILHTALDNINGVSANISLSNRYWTNPSLQDAARPRELFVSFPATTVDLLAISPQTANGNVWFMVKDGTVRGANTTVQITAGSGSTRTVIVRNGATTETYSNLVDANAIVTACLASAFVRAFTANAGTGYPAVTAATPIGSTQFDRLSTVSATTGPLGVDWYEGWTNEPAFNSSDAALFVHEMFLFGEGIRAGYPTAKICGPAMIAISSDLWSSFLAAGGGAYLDGISTHLYNMANGHVGMGRYQLTQFEALLAEYGIDDLPRWQSEQGAITCVYGVYHPRRARWQLMWSLLMEQHGFTRELNNVWYDRSHGFWSFPSWWQNDNYGLNPQAPMMRTMAEEVYGKTYTRRLNFGAVDDYMLGSVYTSATGAQAIPLLCTSAVPGHEVLFSLTGTVPATVVWLDCFGNQTTAPVVADQISIPVSDTPTWLRLPAGCTLTPVRALGIPITKTNQAPLSPIVPALDRQPPHSYGGGLYSGNGNDGGLESYAVAPATATIDLDTPTQIDTVLVVTGYNWQSLCSPTDFDVDTFDGTTWTTQATVTRTPTSIHYGSNAFDVGCKYETHWDEQWIFPVSFPAVTCEQFRIVVRDTSWGGEPTQATIENGGQGSGIRYAVFQEILAFNGAHRVPFTSGTVTITAS